MTVFACLYVCRCRSLCGMISRFPSKTILRVVCKVSYHQAIINPFPAFACLQAAGGKAEALAAASANFMRQFRDADSRELKQLTAAQFMNIWEHYDDDGEFGPG